MTTVSAATAVNHVIILLGAPNGANEDILFVGRNDLWGALHATSLRFARLAKTPVELQ